MAVVMYGLSLGVSIIAETLPRPAYAVLSGLNAATVGVIALAAVELSHKSITDKFSRVVVFLSAAAGLLYNALWYFPVLMLVSGVATLVFDYRWLHGPLAALLQVMPWRNRSQRDQSQPAVEIERGDELAATPASPSESLTTSPLTQPAAEGATEEEPRVIPQDLQLGMSWKVGTAIIASFFAAFIVIMTLRSTLHQPPLLFQLSANMLLAGTIIFGGGPVVIPLLREYVVAEGWVSPRDFLIGLAIVQALPGPNFNFAVFLGGLTAINGGYSAVAGAVVSWLAIFSPGMVLVHGTMGIWGGLRGRRWVKSGLRGVNAGAVGLIYTAVYRIWKVGYIDEGFTFGRSLGDDPWWVVVTATSYVGGRWFSVNPPLAIISGAVLGLVRYGVVSAQE
jgi:chromate transport protein ChrA